MSLATGRTLLDADSHLMELPDFLVSHADPELRDRMPRIKVEAPRLQGGLEEAQRRGGHPPERVQEMIALRRRADLGTEGIPRARRIQ